MLIRSNRPFQGGGNGETIVPEECGPLKVPERRNGGWKQMVDCQEYLPCLSCCFFPLTPSAYVSFLPSLSPPLMSVNWQSRHGLLPGITICLGCCQITTPLSQSRYLFPGVSNTQALIRKYLRGRAMCRLSWIFFSKNIFLTLARQIHDTFCSLQHSVAALSPTLSSTTLNDTGYVNSDHTETRSLGFTDDWCTGALATVQVLIQCTW